MRRQYETTFVIDAHLSGEQVDTTITKYTQFIEKNKGKVEHIDRWGKRRLAYEIAKKQYGYYVYVRFEADGSFVKEFERELRLDDSILRYLTVLVPKLIEKKKVDRELSSPPLRTEEVTAKKEADDELSLKDSEPTVHETGENGEEEKTDEEAIENRENK